ncbi:hypothetical protein BASA62_005590 [Batrachochytrium salamandrivorans]|nr:hypothetical protein BASA62_005590 [Batrachochytrium salamandrivorans]
MNTPSTPQQLSSKKTSTACANIGKTSKCNKSVFIPADVNNETVYKLITEEYMAPAKDKRYRSQFADQAREEYNSSRMPDASMGPAKVQVNAISDFLRKGGRAKMSIPVQKSMPDKTIRKAPIPTSMSVPISPSKKNFVKQNALDNINSTSIKWFNEIKFTSLTVVASKHQSAPPSYIAKKDYGRAPDYLKRRITELKELEHHRTQELTEMTNSRNMAEGVVPLPDEERSRILDGLQANWEKLNSDYQRLSLTVDTVPKIARKVNMEQQLKQYEELIERFSNTNIHVNFNGLYN